MVSKVAALYFSPTFTGEKVVKAICNKISDELGFAIQDINITYAKFREERKVFDETQLVVLGLPVYGGRIPEKIESYVHSLKGENTLAVVVSVYGNRDYDDALLEMKDILSERGFNVIGAGAFIGEHSFTKNVATNRPDESDINIAEKFAKEIGKKVTAINNGEAVGDFNVKGNLPYKERKAGAKFTPVVNENCTKCGVCVKHCPVDAIDSNDPTVTDIEKCMKCSACVKYCPSAARNYEPEAIAQTVSWLESTCSERREPELFL